MVAVAFVIEALTEYKFVVVELVIDELFPFIVFPDTFPVLVILDTVVEPNVEEPVTDSVPVALMFPAIVFPFSVVEAREVDPVVIRPLVNEDEALI